MGAVRSIARAQRRAPSTDRASERHLRLGVVHRGRILEEKVFPPGRSLSVGAHPRATLLLPGDGGPPERLELFATRRGQLHLVLSPDLRGKVDLGDGVVTLDGLRARGPSMVPLPPAARGKVQVGDFTLLFQLVDPPARPRTRPRGALRWSDVDWVFLAVVLVSSLMHAAAVLWIQAQPPPSRIELQELGREFVAIALPPPAPEPVAERAAPDPESDPTPVDRQPSPEPAAPSEPPPAPQAAPAPQASPPTAPLRPEDHGLLYLIGGGDAPALQALLDLDPSSLNDAALQEALAQSSVRIARDRLGPGPRGPEAVGDGMASIGALEGSRGCAHCPAPQAKPPRAPKVPVLEVAPPTSPDGAFDIAPSLKRIGPRFKACYERALKQDPDLAGRISVSFVTDGAARVTEAWIEADSMGSDQANACVLDAVRRMSLPPEAADLDVRGYGLMFTAQ
jgi:hypothetical protein